MARKKGKYSKDNKNITSVDINFTIENLTLMDLICRKKGITKHEFINNLLDNEFSKIDKNKLSDIMAELEKL